MSRKVSLKEKLRRSKQGGRNLDGQYKSEQEYKAKRACKCPDMIPFGHCPFCGKSYFLLEGNRNGN